MHFNLKLLNEKILIFKIFDTKIVKTLLEANLKSDVKQDPDSDEK